MKYLELIGTFILVGAVIIISFACGLQWASGMAEPEVVREEVMVYVPVEQSWDKTLKLGITHGGSIEDWKDGTDYFAVVIIDYNVGPVVNEIVAWIPIGGDEYAGLVLTIPSNDYTISIELQGGTLEKGDEF